MTRSDEIQDVLEQLSALAPTEADAPTPAPQALARIKGRIRNDNRTWLDQFLWRFKQMFKRKYALSGLSAVLLLLIAFSLPPVRAAASDFLGLFRVQKFAPVSVSPRQLALLEEVAEQGLHPGTLEMVEEPGEPQVVGSLAEAEAIAGHEVRTPAALAPPDSVRVAEGGSGHLTIDVENARRILEAVEVDPRLLPDSLDGERVSVTTFAGVEQQWADGTVLMQTASPEVAYPEDVDPVVLGEALLQVLGMTPGEARRLAQNVDWTSTLLLPVPQDLATFREVRVDGISGLALSDVDGRGHSLLWQKEGTVYLLVGDGSLRELVRIADSLEQQE